MAERLYFSIIIPTFNRATFLKKTLESTIQQRYSNFEVIVVDDGGTDNTEDLVNSFNDKRFFYYRKNNAERAAARNFGILKSRGNYITFLDSDDLLKENHLTAASKYVENNSDVDVFHLGYDVVDSDGYIQYPWKKMPDPINKKLIKGNFLSCLGVFAKREILESTRFNEDIDLSGSEDYELWVRLAARYPIRTCYISTALLVNHDMRSVLEINAEKFEKRIRMFKHYASLDDFVNTFYTKKDLQTMFAFKDLYAALHLSISRNKIIGLRYLSNALINHPLILLNYRFWIVIKKMILF